MSMNDFLNMLTEDQKKALLKALMDDNTPTNLLPKETKQESIKHLESSIDNNFVMNKQENSGNNKRREQVRAKQNQWRDDGEFKDIETPHYERTPRIRKPQKQIEVKCSVCGKMFKEDPRYMYGEYRRCSRCVK